MFTNIVVSRQKHRVSNHAVNECLFNSFLSQTTKKACKLHITGPFVRRHPPPPLQTKTYTTLLPIIAKRGFFFQWETRIREVKK